MKTNNKKTENKIYYFLGDIHLFNSILSNVNSVCHKYLFDSSQNNLLSFRSICNNYIKRI